MALRLAVILPVLDEAERIELAVTSAFAAGADRVIVSDGGSSDGTEQRARTRGAEVIRSSAVRGEQANAGAAAAADCDLLCFLHGDSELPPGAGTAIRVATGRGALSGGFLLTFRERDPGLQFSAALINLRTRLTRAPWGDQSQFFTRDAFVALGGYLPIPIMEDYDMAIRARRLGRPAILTSRVTTSGRRFLERGLVRTTLTNWRIIARYHAGTPPEQLAAEYRRPQAD